MRGPSLVAASRGHSPVVVHGVLLGLASLVAEHRSRHVGFSSCSAQALERGLSSCGACGAQLLCGTWNPPGPGIEPVSPILAGGFFTPKATREAQKIF